MKVLEDADVLTELRDLRTQFNIPRDPGAAGFEAGLADWEKSERETLGSRFDEVWLQMQSDWRILESSQLKSAFATLRDKYTAHLELRFVDGAYQPIDITLLGLKWRDPGEVARAMDSIVMGIGFLVRGSDFDMSTAMQQFQRMSTGFWSNPS
jgi:hypothetical protein